MKLVVFSDIHGNYEALKEMFSYTRTLDDIEGYLFCGDIMGYFYEQEAIIEFMDSQSKVYSVLGNHDMYYLEMQGDRSLKEKLVKLYGKSYAFPVSIKVLHYLEKQSMKREICIGGKRILLIHGSRENPLEGRIYPDTDMKPDPDSEYDIIFCGHTHYRMSRRCGKTIVLNPGSLGQPRDGGGFSYCIYDVESGCYEFKTVAINKAAILKNMETLGEGKLLINYIQSTFERNEGYENA